MSFFRALVNHRKGLNKNRRSFQQNLTFETDLDKARSRSQSRHRSEILADGVQQWSYYRDLAIQSGRCTISSELVSLRHSRLNRSLYNLVYTPNDELNYFILYMESCSLSSYLKFILDVQAFEKLARVNQDQQTAGLTLFHRYLSLDANYSVPIDDEIRRTTLCTTNVFSSLL